MATKKELEGHKWVLVKLGTNLPYQKVVLESVKGQEAKIQLRKGYYTPVTAHINIRHLKLIKWGGKK